jgi:Domain of unknown function (DUF5658)
MPKVLSGKVEPTGEERKRFMRAICFIGRQRSIRFASLVTLAVVSLAPRLLATQGTLPKGDRPNEQAIASRARDGWRIRTASAPGRDSDPRRFERGDPLDEEIHRVSQQLAELDREPDFAPVAKAFTGVSDPGSSTATAFPLSFQIMGLTSIALSLGGLVVVIRNRPALAGLRGKNDTSEARRNLMRCVALLLVVNLADLGFTVFLVPFQEFIELNPLANSLRDCLPALVAAKLLLTGACAASFLAFWRYKVVQFTSWGAATTYVGLAMWWVAYFNAARS